MKGSKSEFVCRACGARTPKWVGRCPDCGGWDCLDEERAAPASLRARPARGADPVPLSEIASRPGPRRPTGIAEFDRALGGGLISGQAILVGGEPGIGKSTLLLQALGASGLRALYVCAEESPEQVKMRARRLGIEGREIHLLPETGMDETLAAMDRLDPDLTVVDSIQMMHLADAPGAPGSVGQVRECAMAATAKVKERRGALFLVGHVTKEGSIAGPRVLEHVVDTVLSFEGDRFQSYRLLRAVKNRFGPTMELGIFEMAEDGLRGVTDPSGIFLAGTATDAPGGAVVPCLEGRRPLLVEMQGLVSPSPYGTAVRRATGVDANRLPMLLSVLEKRGGLMLGGQDVFVNAVGGVRVTEPAADLGVVLAVASSFLEKPLPQNTVAAGEVGLRGEVRPVPRSETRLREAAKLGFTRAIFPPGGAGAAPAGIEVEEVSTITEALAFLQ